VSLVDESRHFYMSHQPNHTLATQHISHATTRLTKQLCQRSVIFLAIHSAHLLWSVDLNQKSTTTLIILVAALGVPRDYNS